MLARGRVPLPYAAPGKAGSTTPYIRANTEGVDMPRNGFDWEVTDTEVWT